MTDPHTDTLETILRQCAAAAPQPWYPRDYAEATGVPRDALDPPLERLRLRGLIRLTEWVQGRGQGYALTPDGERVLHNPGLLAQLRAGSVPAFPEKREARPESRRPATPYERGETVRAALASTSRPVITTALVAVNVAVFLAGLVLATQRNLPLGNFVLSSDVQILEKTGAVSFVDLLRGEWWRLLTSCFVHVGLLHLGVNMYALYNVGPAMERFLGRWRYLAVYLISGFGGSCIGVVGQSACAGASGALCGLLGALAAWTFLNREYLPPPVLASLQRYLVTNSVLIAAISVFGYQYISWSGHLGGAVFGLVAGALFNVERFGSVWVRCLAVVGLLALPVAGLGAIEYRVDRDPRWRGVREGLEIDQFNEQVLSRFADLCWEARGVYGKQADPLLLRNPRRRDPAAVARAIAALSEAEGKLREAAGLMARAGPYTSPSVVRVQEAGKDYAGQWLTLLEMSERCLREGESWQEKDERELRAQEKRALDATDRWNELFKRPS